MSLLLALQGGAGDVTGTLATTLAGASLVASGTETIQGSFASTLGGATLAASGAETFAGQFAAQLAGATLAAAGAEIFTGTLASTLEGATLEALGAEPEEEGRDGAGYARPFVRLKPKRFPPPKPEEPKAQEPPAQIPVDTPPAPPISSEPWWMSIESASTPAPRVGRAALVLEGAQLAAAGVRLIRDDAIAFALDLPPLDELAEFRP